jgi:hypothetical protein
MHLQRISQNKILKKIKEDYMNPINSQREDGIRSLLERKKRDKKNPKNENLLVNQFTTLKIEARLKSPSDEISKKEKENDSKEFFEKLSHYDRPYYLTKKLESTSLIPQQGSFKPDIQKSTFKQKMPIKRSFEELEEYGANLQKSHIENNRSGIIIEGNIMKRFKQNDCEKKFMNKYLGGLEQPSRDTLWFELIFYSNSKIIF